jgi:hypothetical protein
MSEERPLSEQTREDLAGLLAAVRHPPVPMGLSEKLSVAELIRKWFVHALVALALVGGFIWKCAAITRQVSDNTEIALSVKDLPARVLKQEKQMRHIRPLVRRHEWQVQQGLTNADLKAKGITPPEFPEED